jgi:anhydro-N-acetylmuramic acid kinase
MDSIDAGLFEFGDEGLICKATYQTPLPAALRQQVYHLAVNEQAADDYTALDSIFGDLFANATIELLAQANIPAASIKAIGCHGQTVRHEPLGTPGISIQLGDIERIARKTGILTIGDFRTPDIEAGGQGAPLAPGFHAWYFRSSTVSRCVINLGGIANISWLPASEDEPILGWDVGPANALLDALAERYLHQPYDDNGRWAASGQVNVDLLDRCLADPYFALRPPKSTGKSLFNLDWLDKILLELNQDIRAEDVECTLVHLSAKCVADAVNSLSSQCEVILCGGGTNNHFMWQILEQYLDPGHSVLSSKALGLHPQWVEAACFAWLARQRVENRPGNLPSVTGAQQAVLLGTLSKQHVTVHPD